MDETVPGLGTFLLSQGVLGAAVLVLLAAVWKLFGFYKEAQEKRIEEARESARALAAAATAMEQLTDLIKAGVARSSQA